MVFLTLISNKPVLVGKGGNLYNHIYMLDKLKYKTISSIFQYEIPKIKGSRFFTTLFPIHSKEDIDCYLEQINKKYYDATHNCYAWRLGVDANQDLFGNWNISSHQDRANDDGEPSNSAGKPILSVLTGSHIFNVLAVTTRYFGGTLLGVGGLIQAYTESSKQAIANASFEEQEITKEISLSYSYEELSTLQYLYLKYGVKIIGENYSSSIQKTITINVVYYNDFLKELTDKQISFK